MDDNKLITSANEVVENIYSNMRIIEKANTTKKAIEDGILAINVNETMYDFDDFTPEQITEIKALMTRCIDINASDSRDFLQRISNPAPAELTLTELVGDINKLDDGDDMIDITPKDEPVLTKPVTISEVLTREVLTKEFKSGATYEDISKKYGYSVKNIQNHCSKIKYSMRQAISSPIVIPDFHDKTITKAIELNPKDVERVYTNTKKTVTEAAKELGCGKQVLHTFLETHPRLARPSDRA